MSLTHIETIELGSTQSSITFSSIPQDYDDLKILYALRHDVTSAGPKQLFIYINGGSINSSNIVLFGSGQSADSFSQTATSFVNGNYLTTANTFNNGSVYFSNYTSSNSKSLSNDVVTENNGTFVHMAITAGLWDSSAAITSITFTPEQGSLIAGCTASLYGITAGGDGTVTTA